MRRFVRASEPWGHDRLVHCCDRAGAVPYAGKWPGVYRLLHPFCRDAPASGFIYPGTAGTGTAVSGRRHMASDRQCPGIPSCPACRTPQRTQNSRYPDVTGLHYPGRTAGQSAGAALLYRCRTENRRKQPDPGLYPGQAGDHWQRRGADGLRGGERCIHRRQCGVPGGVDRRRRHADAGQLHGTRQRIGGEFPAWGGVRPATGRGCAQQSAGAPGAGQRLPVRRADGSGHAAAGGGACCLRRYGCGLCRGSGQPGTAAYPVCGDRIGRGRLSAAGGLYPAPIAGGIRDGRL